MTACGVCAPDRCTQLSHARRRWPRAGWCAAVDRGNRFVCPYPLDPANGDHHVHPGCSDEGRRALAAARAAETARQSAPARAALAARGAAA